MATATLLALVLSFPGAMAVLWSLLIEKPGLDGAQQEPFVVRQHRHHHGQEICLDDRNCARGMFCDRHYGTCEFHRKHGDFCRRDGHCERGHECVYGFCRRTIKKGEKGARCRLDSECGSNMCCARHHGEFVCQQRLVLGQKCYVPFGGLDYSLNELCPCEEHLTCKYVDTPNRNGESTWKMRHDQNHLRCAPSS